MVTVWIFFGSDETCGGPAAGGGAATDDGGEGAAVGGGGGQGESAAEATCPGVAWLGTAWPVVAGALKPGGIWPWLEAWFEP